MTSDPVVSLTAKLAALDLPGAERRVLERILDRAASVDDEVEGFKVQFHDISVTFRSPADLFPKVAAAAGLAESPWSDDYWA
jgi:hypothetical protein